MANRVRTLYFFAFCCQAAWTTRFADYLQEKGFSGFELGFLLSLTPAMMFLFQPVYGFLADRIGLKKALLLGAALAGVLFLGHLFRGGGFWQIALVTAAMSLFFNATQPLIDSLALKTAEATDGSVWYGSLRIAGAVAWSFTGFAGGFLIDVFSLKIIWLVASATMFLTFLVGLGLPKNSGGAVLENSEGAASFKTVLGDGQLRWFLVLTIFIAIAQTAIWNFYSLFMKEIGATDSLTGWGFTLQGLFELPLFYFSAHIIGHFGLKNTLIFTLAVTAFRMFLYSAVQNPKLALLIEMTHGFSWSLFWVACVELVNGLVRDEWKATGQSLLYAAYFGIGMIGGNFWTSFLIENMTLAQVFLLNAGLVLTAALGVSALLHQPKNKAQL